MKENLINTHPLVPRSWSSAKVKIKYEGHKNGILEALVFRNLACIAMFSKTFCRFVNPFPNNPWFLRVCSISLLKTLWEKEILLVSPLLENFLPFSSKLKLLSANPFSLEESKVCRLGKG